MQNKYWWNSKGDKIATAIQSYVNNLENDQDQVHQDNMKNLRLYGNYEIAGAKSFANSFVSNSFSTQNRVTLNIVQSMIDTVVSKITKNKPKPSFVTSGGDWSDQQKAKKLTKFCEGQFYSTEFYEKATLAFQDACIFGTGAVKLYIDSDLEIKAERVFIDEIKVNMAESMFEKPTQLHQVKYIHKEILKANYPKFAADIEMLGKSDTDFVNSTQNEESSMVKVTESWHLRSNKDAKDGKHVISIENITLFEEEYQRDYFPFVFFRWNVRPVGFFGQGISEQLTGLQLEINKLLRTIQVAMHLVSVPKIYIDSASKIVDSHIDNKIGGIIRFQGNPPIPGVLGSIPPELFSHLDRLYQRAYEIVGISQLSATSQKPSGLDSGAALREYNDLETERFMVVAERYEDTFMDAAAIFIDLAKDLDEMKEDSDYKVKIKGSKFLETIKWKDVSLDEDKYIMEVFPTSALSSTPAGRLQEIQELLQAGFISQEDGMKLLDFPDLEGYYNMVNSGVEDIEAAVERMMDKGVYETPEPYQNLGYGVEKMQQAYLLFRRQGAPDAKLDLLRRWMEEANGLITRAQQPPEQIAPVQDPMAIPEAQPTSDLMPVVPGDSGIV